MPEHTPAPTFSRSVYGFVLFFVFKTLFITYIIWALVPEHLLIQLNITYFPNKYWTIAIPILILNYTALFGFCIYPGLNFCMTPSIDDTRTFADKYRGAIVKNISNKSPDFLNKSKLQSNKFFDECGGGDEKITRRTFNTTNSVMIDNSKRSSETSPQFNYVMNEGEEVSLFLQKGIQNQYRIEDYCSCKSSKSCYRKVYDKDEHFTSKRVKNLSLVLHSIPPVEDLSISEVCQKLYLK